MNAGGYIVDDTASNNGAICMEPTVTGELLSTYGISVAISQPASPLTGGPTSDFYWDLVTVFQALHVVHNNGNGTVGGGGAPIAPLAPPICGI